MVFLKLEPPCAKSSPFVSSVDPVPWTFQDIILELQSVEKMLGITTPTPLRQPPVPKDTEQRLYGRNTSLGSPAFVMRAPDDDDDMEFEEEEEDEDRAGTRFSCPDFDFSDSEESEDEVEINKPRLMRKKTLEEGILSELELEDQLKVKEKIRSKLSVMELEHKCERERLFSTMLDIERYTEKRRELDRKMDQQYQRKIAEITDDHLSAIQRDHEQISQIEERRIRDDAALEEAKQKEKARQERAKAEAEARLKAAKKAEEEKVAQQAARRAHEEAAKKEAADKERARLKELAAAEIEEKAARQRKESGIRVLAADNAIKAEANRVKLYNEVAENIHISQKDFDRHGRQINKILSQIGGTVENVKSKAHALINIVNNPALPNAISNLIFAQKVVSICETPRGTNDLTVFACARVILLVASQSPALLDFVLAEFHRVCIYTVPKHFHPSDASFQTNDYWKLIGYKEEDNRMENADSYLTRMDAYMKLYAALIQTEIQGIRNPHGIEQGWAWLSRFLNVLPANRSTATALYAFLKMAGYTMFKRYKSQFLKILNTIQLSYLPKLKEREGQKDAKLINELEHYFEVKSYTREPEGWRLEEHQLDSEVVW